MATNISSSFEDRLLIDLRKRLENASWAQYVELFELITGKKLNAHTQNETWKAIIVLFQMRNMLTHGKTIELKFYRDNPNDAKLTTKYSNVLTYLKEVGIIDTKDPKFNPRRISLVTDATSDFFHKMTVQFISDIYIKHFNGRESMMSDSFEIAFSDI